ncbi:MAG: hypothetical protein INR68_18210 [Methylobacterium mesophilicum]|nr:hypothetical protein [Methylobacterium mesophilicum]
MDEYLVEAQEEWRLAKAMDAAHNAMPEWARVGPAYLLPDGTKGGGYSGMPEVAVLPNPPKDESNKKLIRPTLKDVWERHRFWFASKGFMAEKPDGSEVWFPSPTNMVRRRKQRLAAFKEVREVIDRVREKKAWQQRVGLPRLEAEYQEAYERRWRIRERIEAEAAGASPAELAILALFQFNDEEEDFPLTLMRRLSPSLTGVLRRVVDDMAANARKSINDTLFMGGPGGDV